MSKKLPFKSHARLLTMLGDQLIKNERIALVEILKNSYDADASWVKVTFQDFDDNFSKTPTSTIIIEDDGTGITADVFEKHWVNPATPLKKLAKIDNNDTTPLGRRIQGEKGIGRFALLKLGKRITITSRAQGETTESHFCLDLTPYDDDFLTEHNKKKRILLEDINATLTRSNNPAIQAGTITLGSRKRQRKPQGTRIEISNLRGTWNQAKVEEVCKDISRFQSIFAPNHSARRQQSSDWEVFFYKNEDYKPYSEEYLDRLRQLLDENTVFRIQEGTFDPTKREYRFKLNGRDRVLALTDPDITGDALYRKYFGKSGEHLTEQGIKCGPFSFAFFVFDFSHKAQGKHQLDKADSDLLKDHRIYLYRDNVRVYPYGDPKDDWLQIDTLRGTVSAGWFLSMDQVVGHVNITQRDNPGLIDKTNREGLIETGQPHEDFLHLLQIFLRWVRKKPYATYRLGLEQQKDVSIFKLEKVLESISDLEESVHDNKKATAAVHEVRRLYEAERRYLVRRAETTEALAGVGLSVETAAHDIMAVMGKALIWVDNLVREVQAAGELDKHATETQLTTLRGMLSFVESQLKDVQLLFRSTKQRRRTIRITEILDKVARLYKTTMEKAGVRYDVEETGPPLVAKTTDAVLLQLLLNLFDNAVYWLESVPRDQRKINILLDGDEQTLTFSDTGPGIRDDDRDYIFEPFYSGKGEEGRGLGLYIARQLLERHDYSIELAELKRQRRLKGANFIVSFVQQED